MGDAEAAVGAFARALGASDEEAAVAGLVGALAAGASATVAIVVTPAEGGDLVNQAYAWNGAWDEIDPDYALFSHSFSKIAELWNFELRN